MYPDDKKTKEIMKSSFSEKSVDIIIYTILGVWSFMHTAFYPSGSTILISIYCSQLGECYPYSNRLEPDPYKYAMEHPAFLRALSISVVRTVAGVLISLTMLILTAYPLSKSHEVVPLAPVFKGMMIVAMLTSGGLIPMYRVMSWIKLTNTFWALVLPGCLSLWNCFMVMNFFRTIPSELEEAAVVDGANSFQILVRIYLPLSVRLLPPWQCL